jgi:hypothetical protein
MDHLAALLEDLRRHVGTDGHFRGLLHLLIGRRITAPDGTLISTGQTWRSVAALLKRARWDKDAVAELGLQPADLPPRDRERYWYTAIGQAQVNSESARKSAEQLAAALRARGYEIGPPPGA